MPISVNVSGSWKTATPSVRVSGAWKTVTTGSVRVGGAWKEFYTSYVPPGLSASLSPGSLSGSGYGAGPFTTTGSVTTTASGGSPSYSYLWEFVSGDSSITPDNSTSQTTTFSASGTPTQTKNATYRCKVTDAAANVAYTGNVTIALTFNPALSASLSPGSLAVTGYGTGPYTTGSVTASASGGSGGYSYLWELVSGDSSVTPNSSTSAATTFSASGTPTQTKNATYRCRITDSVSNVTYTGNVTVAVTFNPALSVTEDTTSASGTDAQSGPPFFYSPITTNNVTATPAGGAGGYTYLWEYVSGDTGFACNASTSATTNWTYSSVPVNPAIYNATWRCKVTDSASAVVYTASISLTANFDSL